MCSLSRSFLLACIQKKHEELAQKALDDGNPVVAEINKTKAKAWKIIADSTPEDICALFDTHEFNQFVQCYLELTLIKLGVVESAASIIIQELLSQLESVSAREAIDKVANGDGYKFY